jgi:hypothetical protein
VFPTAAGRTLRRSATIVLLAVCVGPGIALSQDTTEAFVNRERQLIEAIEREESLNGPYSEALIAPLTSLSLHYEESGDYRLVDPLIARVLQVIRANYGLYSLEQAPSIRRLVTREAARGNAPAAWDLEMELLMLATRHTDDIRSAGILRDIADRRMDILARYNAGEFPPEIILGCYYNEAGDHLRMHLRGSRPLHVVPGTELLQRRCAAGSSGRAKRTLVGEAQSLYVAAANVYTRNERVTSTELHDLLMEIVRNSFHYGDPGLGRAALGELVIYATESSAAPLPRIEALVQTADWDLLYSRVWGTQYRDSALATYEAAYASLLEHAVPDAAIEALFSPDVPVVLPSFEPSALVASQVSATTPYLDVSFVIRADGRSRNVEVLAKSDDMTRSDERRIVNTVRHSRFRPRVVDGQFADSEPLVVRYYVE